MARTGIAEVDVAAYDIPTAVPESDATAEWKKIPLIVVEVSEGGKKGLGYAYADAGAARMIGDVLADAVRGRDVHDTAAVHGAMVRALRNQGPGGIARMAISAVDVACWDLKAKLLGLPLAKLVGMVRPRVVAYGSGCFTSLSERELSEQLSGWVDRGFRAVKMKVGREPERDLDRVRAARKAIGRDVDLLVDANGAYDRKQALAFADRFAELGVCRRIRRPRCTSFWAARWNRSGTWSGSSITCSSRSRSSTARRAPRRASCGRRFSSPAWG